MDPSIDDDIDSAAPSPDRAAAWRDRPVSRRRITMVFDPTQPATAATAASAGTTLASFVEAMHQDEEAEGPLEPASTLAADGYDYTACATAPEADAELAAWHDLLHGPAD